MITGKLYDRLKFLALVVLPAVGTFYITVAALWDLPKPQEVAATILAVDTFLGALLQISSNAYSKGVAMVGDMIVHEKEGGGTVHTLQIDSDKDLEDLESKNEVRFRVQKKKATPRRRSTVKDETGLTTVGAIVILAFVLALLALLVATGAI